MIVSLEVVLVLMPNQNLTKIIGKPTPKAVKCLEKELGSNLIISKCPCGVGKGYLGELQVQGPAVFLACNGANYTPPAAALQLYSTSLDNIQ